LRTLYLSHPSFLDHLTPVGHPEQPDRIRVIERELERPEFQDLIRDTAPPASVDEVARAHPAAYVEHLRLQTPDEGLLGLGMDTVMSPGTFKAAMNASGAACFAVDEVMKNLVDNAFCAIRPPGHHAETSSAMGFCFFNHAAVAARHAQAVHGAERIAIVDFDVHHGNGTQDIFYNDASVFYASTHQMPLFPGTGELSETGIADNICNAPLSAGDDGAVYREAMSSRVLPALEAFAPDLIIASAGFDAHRLDPMAELALVEADFTWTTQKLMEIADRRCGGRLVSLLEGGYDLGSLARSAAAHVRALLGH
jgi:acetoin utilization deacetylase AcuC-like enzyme